MTQIIRPEKKSCIVCGSVMFNSCYRLNHYQPDEYWVENHHCNHCGAHFWKNTWYTSEEWDAYMEGEEPHE